MAGRKKQFNKVKQISLSGDEDFLERLNKAAYTINLRDNKNYTRLTLIRTWLEERLQLEGM